MRKIEHVLHTVLFSLSLCLVTVVQASPQEQLPTPTDSPSMTEHRLGPVDSSASMKIQPVTRKTSDKSATASFCGLLEYHSDENGWFHFVGVGNGSLIVNFSEGGAIRSRMQESIAKGAWYHYDTKNYRYQLGFTCL